MGDVARGEVVVFKYPEEPERDFIKRVIGLPGETLEVRRKRVFIDGRALDEPYAHFLEPVGPSSLHEVTSFDVREQVRPRAGAAWATISSWATTVTTRRTAGTGDFCRATTSRARRSWCTGRYESGREDYLEGGLIARVKSLASVAVHFFTRTRWDRILHQIR